MTFTSINAIIVDNDNIDDITDPIWSYLGSLSQSGQIYNATLIKAEHGFCSYFSMPEKDSLEDKYCYDFTITDCASVKKIFQIEVEILGIDLEEEPCCTCKHTSWYFLYGRRMQKSSPIICGDCFRSVPAYKFSNIKLPTDVRTELSWQEDYSMIDNLWFNSFFDRFTYKQMSAVDSRLSKDGIAICTAYENALSKPFYFFLFHYNDSRKRRNQCPICGEDWRLSEPIHFITCKCDSCRLLSI